MKKGVLCVLLVFAITFSIAACNGSPVPEGVSNVVLTNKEGESFEVNPSDVKDGTVASDATTKLVTTSKKSNSLPLPNLPKNTDAADPFVTGGNEKAEVITKGVIPDGEEVSVPKDSSGKPKTLLLRDGADGKVLATGKYTMECTLSVEMSPGSGEMTIPATIVTDGKAYSITLLMDTEKLQDMLGGEEMDATGMQVMKTLFGDPMKLALLDDGSKIYLVFPSVGMYLDAAEMGSGLLDIDPNTDMGMSNKEYVKTSKVTVSGKNYTVEEYRGKNSKTNKTVTYRYYFIGEYLKRMETIVKDEEPTIIDVKIIKNKVDSNALKLRKTYQDMGSMFG